jgi:hypothetical protein
MMMMLLLSSTTEELRGVATFEDWSVLANVDVHCCWLR